MTKPNKNYLRIGFVISLLIVIATICEHANTESILRTANGILLGLIRSSIYIGLFAAWRFSVRQRIGAEEHPKVFIGSGLLPHHVDGYQDG